MKNEKGFAVLAIILIAAGVNVVFLHLGNYIARQINTTECVSGFRLESGHCVGEIKVTEASKR